MFFLPECPCCEEGCGVADGKPRTDPVNEGTWVPSGTWRGVGGVTWSFTANPGDDSGETWFFFGSTATSKVGGGATVEEREDWGNICNWYSNRTSNITTTPAVAGHFNKRATRLPPATAVVHVYTRVSTANAGPQVVEYIYFWGNSQHKGNLSSITATGFAHDSDKGAVFNNTSTNLQFAAVDGGALFNDTSENKASAIVNGGAVFNQSSGNSGAFGSGTAGGVVNGGAVFNDNSVNEDKAVVNDGAVFNNSCANTERGVVNGGAVFNNFSINNSFFLVDATVVNGGAVFNDNSQNDGHAIVNGGAVFNDDSLNFNFGVVNGGAVFNESAKNELFSVVNGGAVFNDNSSNGDESTVNGGATFNDAAASFRTVGNFFAVPCTRKFVAHPTDLPVCNGTALTGCDPANASSGCN